MLPPAQSRIIDPSSLPTEVLRKYVRIQAALNKQNGFSRYALDPLPYFEERLGIVLYDGLVEVIESVRDNAETAVKAANGVGKTEIASALVLWWLECYEESIVLTTGSNWNAIMKGLWPRVHKYVDKRNLFPGCIKNNTGIVVSPVRFAFGRASNRPEGIAGTHSPNLLQIVEESSGIAPDIAEAIQGNATGINDRRVYMGNPLSAEGVFYDWCNSPTVNCITLSGLNHPNVTQDVELIRGAVTRRSIEEKAQNWCRHVPPHTPGAIHLPWLGDLGWYIPDYRFEARVLGLFPKTSMDALLPQGLIEQANSRPYPTNPGTIALGVDVARFGDDDTCFTWLCSDGILRVERHHGLRETEITGRIVQELREGRAHVVGIDATGGYGGGVCDMLLEQNIEHTPVVFSESSSEPDRFRNIKAEIYWKFKKQLEDNDKFYIEKDNTFTREATQVRYKILSNGLIEIEPKDAYKRRVGKSPDTIESAMIALHTLTNSAPSAPPVFATSTDSGSGRFSRERAHVGSRYQRTLLG